MLLRIVARTMKKQELCGTKWVAEMEEGKALRQPLRRGSTRGMGGCDNNCKARRTIEHCICSVRTKTKWFSYEKTGLLTKSMNWEDKLLLYHRFINVGMYSLSLSNLTRCPRLLVGRKIFFSRREKIEAFSDLS